MRVKWKIAGNQGQPAPIRRRLRSFARNLPPAVVIGSKDTAEFILILEIVSNGGIPANEGRRRENSKFQHPNTKCL